jgi:hypothetical protein
MKCVHDLANGDEAGAFFCPSCPWIESAAPSSLDCATWFSDKAVVELGICRVRESGENVMKGYSREAEQSRDDEDMDGGVSVKALQGKTKTGSEIETSDRRRIVKVGLQSRSLVDG